VLRFELVFVHSDFVQIKVSIFIELLLILLKLEYNETMYLIYNKINSRLDATMIILLTISISSTYFGR